jgi:Ni/Fe-hydrogenase subunit HybB-like protein
VSADLNSLAPEPLTVAGVDARRVDDDVFRPVESFPTARWWMAISVTGAMAMTFVFCMAYTVAKGIGVWGVNQPVGWGFAIINFVFWIGIGHAGTLISAILFLLRQKWRNAISRFAETMTVIAVMVAGMFPLFHTGRPWLAVFWLFPYPNDQSIWTNFRSPLEWDVFAVSTYFTVSLMFWYTGLLPDLASARDRARHPVRKLVYGLLSLGWKGSARAWRHYEKAYLLFAGLSTPLVLSVHSIVSFDFAVSVVPGWHETILPPYFVAGAILSGFAMVSCLLIVMRRMFRLQHLITTAHVELMNKITIVTSLMMAYAYAVELFMAWYSGEIHERYAAINRAFGPYRWAFWGMLFCNVVAPQLLWFRHVRRSMLFTWLIVLAVNAGMWLERFVIVVVSLHRDQLPSAWGFYRPTWVDVGLLVGSFGIFLTMILLFFRFLPAVSTTELKAAIEKSRGERA